MQSNAVQCFVHVQYRSDARYKFHTRVLRLTASANALAIRDKHMCQFVQMRSLLEANACVSSCKRVCYCGQTRVKSEIAFKAGNVMCIQYTAAEQYIKVDCTYNACILQSTKLMI